MSPEAWRDEAACVDSEVDVFFPDRTVGNSPYRKARAICAGCPVSGECLAYAMKVEAAIPMKDVSGMFGGLAPTERVALRRSMVEVSA